LLPLDNPHKLGVNQIDSSPSFEGVVTSIDADLLQYTFVVQIDEIA
jgi:hypothetical protein